VALTVLLAGQFARGCGEVHIAYGGDRHCDDDPPGVVGDRCGPLTVVRQAAIAGFD